MLLITIPSSEDELWDERNGQFITLENDQVLELEHSLISLSTWESKWCKPFISKEHKTVEETIDYIRCMTLTKDVDPNAYFFITDDNIEKINRYIQAPMTATWFSEEKNGKVNPEQVTTELIYWWMIALDIPLECEAWPFNRLITLIKICNIKNQPAKKLSSREILSRNAQLNEARKKRWNTKG